MVVRRIADNPLSCDCRLSWLSKWLRLHTTLGLFTRCATPHSLRGRELTALQQSSFVCTDGKTPSKARYSQWSREGGGEVGEAPPAAMGRHCKEEKNRPVYGHLNALNVRGPKRFRGQTDIITIPTANLRRKVNK